MGRFPGLLVGVVMAMALGACQAPQQIGSIAAPDLGTPGLMQASTPIHAAAPVAEPAGYAAFCKRDPADCAIGADEPDTIALTPALWSRIQDINSATNAAIKPMEDEIHYGRADYWTIPTDGYGDCEDYALAKRKALADAGLSRRALRLAVVQLPSGEPHAVLTLATAEGDFVLDNRSNEILPWQRASFTWVARQAADMTDWTGFAPRQAPLLLALR